MEFELRQDYMYTNLCIKCCHDIQDEAILKHMLALVCCIAIYVNITIDNMDTTTRKTVDVVTDKLKFITFNNNSENHLLSLQRGAGQITILKTCTAHDSLLDLNCCQKNVFILSFKQIFILYMQSLQR